MPTFRTGQVTEVLEEHGDHQVLRVRIGERERRSVLYRRYAASAGAGDRVVLNTTAEELDLGSGGQDFVVWNLEHDEHEAISGGHIVKLRYTPAQADVLAVESPESEHHETMAAASSLEGIPVVAASLHSQLVPVVCGIRKVLALSRVAYVMTDGGALEVGLSRSVRRLRKLGWLCGSVSVGHALGGDLEAVNVYSGLLAARVVLGADIVVVGMGPGVVGTGTALGTTALDLGMSINAAASLGGRPVAAVRMSEGDERDRHRGLSHHAVVALERVALAPADVPVPRGAGIDLDGHRVVEVDFDDLEATLADARDQGLELSHMGRDVEDDRLFFEAAGVAGIHAATLDKEGKHA